MPNLAKVLKDEIRRLARQEAKTSASSLRAENNTLRRALAEQQRRLSSLEKAMKRTASAVASRQAIALEDDIDETRYTPKMILSLRSDFGMSQTDFGFLCGVTRLTVSQWERKRGYLVLRNATRTSLNDVFKMNPDQAKRRLAKIKR